MYTYLEECKSAIEYINPDVLAATSLGEDIGWGSGFAFHTLGQFPIGESLEWVGVKVPITSRGGTYSRLMQELAFVTYCTGMSPGLRPLIPSFMGMIVVEESDATALITEDASRGDSVEVLDSPTSEEAIQLIYAGFRHIGTERDVLLREELRRTTSFSVDGIERLLDFTPVPVLLTTKTTPEVYVDIQQIVRETVDEFVITLPFDSTLGQDLLRNHEKHNI